MPSSLVEDLALSKGLKISWPALLSLPDSAFHLQSFSALRSLAIACWDVSTDQVPLMLRYFGPSFANVVSLTLKDAGIHSQTLAMFVTRFPQLTDLCARWITFPRRLIFIFQFAWVSEVMNLLEPRFRRVSFKTFAGYSSWRDYWPLVKACAGLLEELCIVATKAGK